MQLMSGFVSLRAMISRSVQMIQIFLQKVPVCHIESHVCTGSIGIRMRSLYSYFITRASNRKSRDCLSCSCTKNLMLHSYSRNIFYEHILSLYHCLSKRLLVSAVSVNSTTTMLFSFHSVITSIIVL